MIEGNALMGFPPSDTAPPLNTLLDEPISFPITAPGPFKILILSFYMFISLLTFPLPLFEKKSPCFQFFMLIWSRVIFIADKMQINTIHVRALLALLLTRGNLAFSFVSVVVFWGCSYVLAELKRLGKSYS